MLILEFSIGTWYNFQNILTFILAIYIDILQYTLFLVLFL